MKKIILANLCKKSLCASLILFSFGCSASQEIIIHLNDDKLVTGKSFTVTDSSVVLPPIQIPIHIYGGYYREKMDRQYSFSQVKQLTLIVPDASSTARFLGGAAGFVLGAWAGSAQGFGPSGGDLIPAALGTSVIGAVLGACVGPYVVDELYLKKMNFDPNIQSQRDSLKVYVGH